MNQALWQQYLTERVTELELQNQRLRWQVANQRKRAEIWRARAEALGDGRARISPSTLVARLKAKT